MEVLETSGHKEAAEDYRRKIKILEKRAEDQLQLNKAKTNKLAATKEEQIMRNYMDKKNAWMQKMSTLRLEIEGSKKDEFDELQAAREKAAKEE